VGGGEPIKKRAWEGKKQIAEELGGLISQQHLVLYGGDGGGDGIRRLKVDGKTASSGKKNKTGERAVGRK